MYMLSLGMLFVGAYNGYVAYYLEDYTTEPHWDEVHQDSSPNYGSVLPQFNISSFRAFIAPPFSTRTASREANP